MIYIITAGNVTIYIRIYQQLADEKGGLGRGKTRRLRA